MNQSKNYLMIAGVFGLLSISSCGKVGPKNKNDQLADRLKAKGKAPVAQKMEGFDASSILNSPDKTCEFMVTSVEEFSKQYLSELTLEQPKTCEKSGEGTYEYSFSVSRKGYTHEFIFRVGHHFEKPSDSKAGSKRTEAEFWLVKNGNETEFDPEDPGINILATNLSHIGATLKKCFDQKLNLFTEVTCFTQGRFLSPGGNSCQSVPFLTLKERDEYGDIKNGSGSATQLDVPEKFIGSQVFSGHQTSLPDQLKDFYQSFYDLMLKEIPEDWYRGDKAKSDFSQLYNQKLLKSLSNSIGIAVYITPSTAGSLTESKLKDLRMNPENRAELKALIAAAEGQKLSTNYKEYEVLIEFPFGYDGLKRAKSVAMILNWVQVDQKYDLYGQDVKWRVLSGAKINQLAKPGITYLSDTAQFKSLTDKLGDKSYFSDEDDQLHPNLSQFFIHLKNWNYKLAPMQRNSSPELPEKVRNDLNQIIESTNQTGSQYRLVGVDHPSYDGASLKGTLTKENVRNACNEIADFQMASESEYPNFSNTHLAGEDQKALFPLASFHLSRVSGGDATKKAGLCVKKSVENSLSTQEDQLLKQTFLPAINSIPDRVLRGLEPVAVSGGKILGNDANKAQVCASLRPTHNGHEVPYVLAGPEDVKDYLFASFFHGGHFICLNKRADNGRCENFETDPIVTLFRKLTGLTADIVDSDSGDVLYGLRESQVIINGTGQPYSADLLRAPNIASNMMSELLQNKVFFCKKR